MKRTPFVFLAESGNFGVDEIITFHDITDADIECCEKAISAKIVFVGRTIEFQENTNEIIKKGN